MTWRDEVIAFFANEGRVIKDAPASFALAVIGAGILLWAALSWKFDAQLSSRDSIIATKDETIKFQGGLIAEYKNRIQLPEAGEDRKLAPEQKRILSREFRIKADKLKTLVIYAVSEREPRQYAKQFADIAQDAGIKVIQREISSTVDTEIGVFVGLPNAAQPSDEAKEFMDILTQANLIAHYTTWAVSRTPEEGDASFDLFIAKPSW